MRQMDSHGGGQAFGEACLLPCKSGNRGVIDHEQDGGVAHRLAWVVGAGAAAAAGSGLEQQLAKMGFVAEEENRDSGGGYRTVLQ